MAELGAAPDSRDPADFRELFDSHFAGVVGLARLLGADETGTDGDLSFAHYPGGGDAGRLAVLQGTVIDRDGCLVLGRPMDKQVVGRSSPCQGPIRPR